MVTNILEKSKPKKGNKELRVEVGVWTSKLNRLSRADTCPCLPVDS